MDNQHDAVSIVVRGRGCVLRVAICSASIFICPRSEHEAYTWYSHSCFLLLASRALELLQQCGSTDEREQKLLNKHTAQLPAFSGLWQHDYVRSMPLHSHSDKDKSVLSYSNSNNWPARSARMLNRSGTWPGPMCRGRLPFSISVSYQIRQSGIRQSASFAVGPGERERICACSDIRDPS